jgi:hypothetical protein
MKTTDTHAFVNQLLVCVLVTISCGGSIGLGTVWVRHQISLTANENRRLKLRIAEVDRALVEIRSQVSVEESDARLAQRNADWQLKLDVPTEPHLVRVQEDPVRRLAARANRELFGNHSSDYRVALGQ